jgi:hypothetical protein
MNPEDLGALLAGSGLLFGLTMALVSIVIPIVAYWKIIGKTGHPSPLALVILFPMAGLILLYWLAFSEWPALSRGRLAPVAPSPVPMPPPPAYSGAPVYPGAPETPVAAAPQAAQPGFRFCTGCGVSLEGIERFCANCGKPVNPGG